MLDVKVKRFNTVLFLATVLVGYTGSAVSGVHSNSNNKSTQKITISPGSFTMASGQKRKLNVTTTGLRNTAIKWSYNGCGWIQKSTGIYHAPKGMRANQTVCFAKIKATSVANPSVSSEVIAKVTLKENKASKPVPTDADKKSLVINPGSLNLTTGQVRKLGVVTTGLQNNAVKWSYTGCGWMERAKGVYHTPNGFPSGQTVCTSTVTARSVDTPSISNSINITVKLSKKVAANASKATPVVVKTVQPTPEPVPAIASPAPASTNSTGERIWLHPAFKRKGNGELENFNFMANSKTIKYYGMRYELPWSLLEKKQGQYDFSELDRVMKNAKQRNLKVYVVLHDKTWYYQNAITNNYPSPGNKTGNEFFYTKANSNKGHTVRSSKRWNPNMEKWYVAAVEAILARRTQNADYSQLEVISLGESSLAYGSKAIKTLKDQGYPGQEWYKDYLIRILQKTTDKANQYYTNDGAVKIAMNLNWIPGQGSPGVNGKWLQHEVLESVKNSPNAVQAIEDVHANGHSALYEQRVYKYTLDNKDRVVPKNRVWAHISCDSKKDRQSAVANLAKARAMAKNITIRHRCDASSKQAGSKFSEYEALLK